MFDIGFWELVLVGVVSLLVFGTERLPRVAKETALWIKKLRRMVLSVKEEIDQELHLQELKQNLLEEKMKIESEISPSVQSKNPLFSSKLNTDSIESSQTRQNEVSERSNDETKA